MISIPFHSRLTDKLFPKRATPYPARATPSALSPSQGILGHLQHLSNGGPEPCTLPRPGSGCTRQQARQAAARGGAPRPRAGSSQRAAPQTGAPLTSWVWRAAAARRGRGEAAGFWPGWDMARPRRALPPGGRSGDCKGGPGGERGEGQREGA